MLEISLYDLLRARETNTGQQYVYQAKIKDDWTPYRTIRKQCDYMKQVTESN